MINFKGKDQIGDCVDRIAAAGHWIRYVDNVLHVSDEKAVQAIVDSYTLADAKVWKAAQVAEFAKGLRDKSSRDVSIGEMASWPIKIDEATRYAKLGALAETPLLTAEAQRRGVALSDLVQKVQAKGGAFRDIEAHIAGVEGKHSDAIKGLRSFEEVAAYDYSAGWPEV